MPPSRRRREFQTARRACRRARSRPAGSSNHRRIATTHLRAASGARCCASAGSTGSRCTGLGVHPGLRAGLVAIAARLTRARWLRSPSGARTALGYPKCRAAAPVSADGLRPDLVVALGRLARLASRRYRPGIARHFRQCPAPINLENLRPILSGWPTGIDILAKMVRPDVTCTASRRPVAVIPTGAALPPWPRSTAWHAVFALDRRGGGHRRSCRDAMVLTVVIASWRAGLYLDNAPYILQHVLAWAGLQP